MPALFDAKSFLKSVTTLPGVYQMLNAEGEVLYVGKAKNLKKRLSSYFGNKALPAKTSALVGEIADVRITVAHSENEALVLESNLIKEYLPRYNVLLRDDKSYPYIVISKHAKFPKLDIYRGQRKRNAEFFGPYPSVGALRETLKLLQKLFKLRQCSDSFFRQRKRPCLQYQIKRCKAPCVNLVSPEEYAKDLEFTRLFLQGKSDAVIDDLIAKMDEAAAKMRYEEAASYRNLVAKLKEIQAKQYVATGYSDADVFAIKQSGQIVCVSVQKIRRGQLILSHHYFPKFPAGMEVGEILSSFIAQFYFSMSMSNDYPKEVLINEKFENIDWLARALSDQAGKNIAVKSNVRGERKQWLSLALSSAEQNLKQKRLQSIEEESRWLALQEALGLAESPNRIECFDISHTMGEATVASCVVVGPTGAQKSKYRKFNITDVVPGDDYAAMYQAVLRRYKRVSAEGELPDVILIDGGKGQLKKAHEALESLSIDDVLVVAIAKGEHRRPGLETLLTKDGEFTLEVDGAAMHLLQFARDESHRFAILGHRGKRKKARQTSTLERIPSVGATRRTALLKHFGGLQGLSKASANEIAKVSGVSAALAEKIYAYFHGGSAM